MVIPSSLTLYQPLSLGTYPTRSYGYNGRDGRNNISFTADGEGLIYHVAGAAIVQRVESGDQKFFLEHTEDISWCVIVLRIGDEGPLEVSESSHVSPRLLLHSTFPSSMGHLFVVAASVPTGA